MERWEQIETNVHAECERSEAFKVAKEEIDGALQDECEARKKGVLWSFVENRGGREVRD
jgi:hypothetical protein